MLRVLVVSSTVKGSESLSTLIREYEGYVDIATTTFCSEARRMIFDNEFDLVVINAPLSDESGEQLASTITEQTLAGVIMVVRNEYLETTETIMGASGVLVVSKPVIKQLFFQTLGLARSMRRRLTVMQNENDKLQKKIEEIKLIDRAKWTLIQNLGMDEQQAHRYIEKQAMDLRKNRYDVASAILKTYQ
ncbi:ANTAR domain-containing protein [uncultured Sphaerochaeta sp.]|uniref:ANTAR domain-containing response regulator n=1 Tax=uncultured Sphaerochaeta sp. TaxID=886478 RepID=UPI002A0A1167|nr:ANTAR domain-containing protein [uncultured Sphaerochaeta sp.]